MDGFFPLHRPLSLLAYGLIAVYIVCEALSSAKAQLASDSKGMYTPL